MHTAGPWRIGGESLDGHLDFPIFDANKEQVAGAHFRATVSTDDDASYTRVGQTEAWANARLIASAPKLLEALKKAVAYGPNLSQTWFDEAKDAIREATGE